MADVVTVAVGVAVLAYGTRSALHHLCGPDEEEGNDCDDASSEGATSGYVSSEDTVAEKPPIATSNWCGVRHVERRPSFTITNEHGEARGALDDETTRGWGWQVMDDTTTRKRKTSGVLRDTSGGGDTGARSGASGSESDSDADASRSRARRSALRVRFSAKELGFYGFVFSYDGAACATHCDGPFMLASRCPRRMQIATRCEHAPSHM